MSRREWLLVAAFAVALGAVVLTVQVRLRQGESGGRTREVVPVRPPHPRCLLATDIGTRFHSVVEIMLCNDQWSHDYNSTQVMRNKEPKSARHIKACVERFRVDDAQLDELVTGLREHKWAPTTNRDPGNLQLDYLTEIEGVPRLERFTIVSNDDLRAVYRILLSTVRDSEARKAIEDQSQEFALE
jgi:hypothetical protein